MEHEVSRRPLIRLFFYLRLFTMGSADAPEFLQGGIDRLQEIFPWIEVNHSPSGKSRLMICQK